jgi:hypothetical protein
LDEKKKRNTSKKIETIFLVFFYLIANFYSENISIIFF